MPAMTATGHPTPSGATAKPETKVFGKNKLLDEENEKKPIEKTNI